MATPAAISPVISLTATVLMATGAVAVLLAAFALWGGHLVQARDQDRLRGELAKRFTIDRASEASGGDTATVVAGSEFGGESDDTETEGSATGSGPAERATWSSSASRPPTGRPSPTSTGSGDALRAPGGRRTGPRGAVGAVVREPAPVVPVHHLSGAAGRVPRASGSGASERT